VLEEFPSRSVFAAISGRFVLVPYAETFSCLAFALCSFPVVRRSQRCLFSGSQHFADKFSMVVLISSIVCELLQVKPVATGLRLEVFFYSHHLSWWFFGYVYEVFDEMCVRQ
jgi:hypothetical protein